MELEEKNQFYGFSKEEQILHIVSELERGKLWKEKGNEKYFLANIERAMRLTEFLSSDRKWEDNRLAVIALKEMISKIYSGGESIENILKVL